MAFIRLFSPTSSIINACLAGISKAFTVPRNVANRATCQTLIRFMSVNMPRERAGIIDND